MTAPSEPSREELARRTTFATTFARALYKLREADKENKRCVLDRQEVKAVVAGLRLLRSSSSEPSSQPSSSDPFSHGS